ncbi:FAD-dependent monooxygenase [Pelagibacteraceae bacterium]|jgi:salicylate hydroxylase|nr:FAD-dependent monooxygenase [Pelagibacteraceae bacterium]
MKKKIAIIGSGLAGLTLASLLKKNTNFEFSVYEKESSLNLDEGFGIQLAVNSVSILNKIGFTQINKSEKCHPLKLDFYSENSKKICDLDLTSFNSENEKYTTIKRSSLIKFLKGKLLTNSLIFSKEINNVVEKNQKININFTDGSIEEVDYLVVSDGVFSNSKIAIENKIFKPIYYGASAFRIQIKSQNISNFNINNISLVMGANSHLVSYPINQDKELNIVYVIRKKLESNEDIKQVLNNSILNENKNLKNLFQKTSKSWPLYISNKPTKSIYKNVFYIGDAFYTFPPTMAQGASQAIESAYEIFNLIKDNNSDIQNVYFNNRLKRTNIVTKRSKFNYFSFHISNQILRIFRNKVLKFLVKNKKFINSYLGKVYK